jgi:hypothetical protein
VRRDQRRPRRRLRPEQPRQLELSRRIDAAGRLVEHEQIGLGRENRRERKALALAAREVARVPRFQPGQPDDGEPPAGGVESPAMPSATSSSARSQKT